jgi:hypothetical protein
VQEALLESAKSSSEAAAEAARQEQESAAAPQPPETPAGTEATPAGTAATPAATVAPEIPEAEALRQATGAPTQAEEAAATADKNGAPTPTTNPTVVTSIQSTISDIMGGEEAQFDEGKRLQELKEKFGLGISDMEKAAPGLAFAFSLMGSKGKEQSTRPSRLRFLAKRKQQSSTLEVKSGSLYGTVDLTRGVCHRPNT